MIEKHSPLPILDIFFPLHVLGNKTITVYPISQLEFESFKQL